MVYCTLEDHKIEAKDPNYYTSLIKIFNLGILRCPHKLIHFEGENIVHCFVASKYSILEPLTLEIASSILNYLSGDKLE